MASMVRRGRWGLCIALLLALTWPLIPALPVGDAPTADPLADVRALIKAGKYAEAEAAGRAALVRAEGRDESSPAAAADALDLLVEALWRGGKFKDSETHALAKRAVETREALAGPEDLSLVPAVTNLAIVERRSGSPAEAEPLLRRALAIQERRLGGDDPAVARTLNSLGILLKDVGRFEESRQIHERALAIRERAFGADHPDVAASLQNLGALMLILGDFEAARGFEERSLQIMERTLGPEHPTLIDPLTNLATALGNLGEVEAARAHLERTLTLIEKTLGREHPLMATSLQNLGQMLSSQGEYERAEELLRRALSLRAATNGEEHFQYAEILGNLGNLLVEEGDHAAARPILERALTVFEKSLGRSHPETAQAADSLGNLLALMHEPEAARLRYEQAIEAQEHVAGSGGAALASYLTHLAQLDTTQGRNAQALAEAQRALEISQASHPEAAGALSALARIKRLANENTEAVSLLERALAVRERFVGDRHPLLAETLVDLSRCLEAAGEPDRSFAAALRAEAITRDHVRLTARSLPERRALLYAASRARGLDQVLAVLERSPLQARSQVSQAWDSVIRSRAMVLDEMAARQQAALSPADEATARQRAVYAAASARYANLVLAGRERLDAADYAKMLGEARAAHESAEHELARLSLAFARRTENEAGGLAQVLSSLPADSALVAYVTYADREGPRYGAFVARGPAGAPIFKPLGPAGPIERAVRAWREEIIRDDPTGDPGMRRYLEAAADLRRRVWDPLRQAAGGAGHVLVVPEGTLHLVTLASLPAGRHEFLIESGPSIHYLSAERDLLSPPRPKDEAALLLALGGPDFAAGGAPAEGHAPQPAAGGTPRSACLDASVKSFPPLPGAAKEARAIAGIWSEGRSPGSAVAAARPPTVLTGAEATESALRRSAAASTVMHLATHSFFVGDGCPGSLDSARRGVGGLAFEETPASKPAPRPWPEDPLRLSGLALAGANRRDAAIPPEDDGFLTAEEVASLDLSSVEWAVLSACDTGLGTLQSSEGVLGLRRAFRIAGARTLIMSLWPVDDEATERWMSALYEGRLRDGLSTDEAVRAAGRSVLSDLRRAHKSPHPSSWAAFVAVGDWR